MLDDIHPSKERFPLCLCIYIYHHHHKFERPPNDWNSEIYDKAKESDVGDNLKLAAVGSTHNTHDGFRKFKQNLATK